MKNFILISACSLISLFSYGDILIQDGDQIKIEVTQRIPFEINKVDSYLGINCYSFYALKNDRQRYNTHIEIGKIYTLEVSLSYGLFDLVGKQWLSLNNINQDSQFDKLWLDNQDLEFSWKYPNLNLFELTLKQLKNGLSNCSYFKVIEFIPSNYENSVVIE